MNQPAVQTARDALSAISKFLEHRVIDAKEDLMVYAFEEMQQKADDAIAALDEAASRMEHHQIPGTLTDLRKSLEGTVSDWVIEELDACIEALLKAPVDMRMYEAGESMAKELTRIARGEGAVGRINHCVELADAWQASKLVVVDGVKDTTPEMAFDMEMDAYESERSLWHSQLWIPIATELPPIHENPADDERGYVLLLMQHASWKPNAWKTVKGSRVMLEDGWYWSDEEGEILDEDNELITHWMEIPPVPSGPGMYGAE